MNVFGGQEVRLFDDEEIGAGIPQRAAYGQIWQLGKHRLMCGDSANTDQVNALMAGELADMVFTDPPYGVSIGDKNKALQEAVKCVRITENIINDTLSAEDLKPILVKAMTNARLSCKDDAVYFVTSPQGGGVGDDDDDDGRCGATCKAHPNMAQESTHLFIREIGLRLSTRTHLLHLDKEAS